MFRQGRLPLPGIFLDHCRILPLALSRTKRRESTKAAVHPSSGPDTYVCKNKAKKTTQFVGKYQNIDPKVLAAMKKLQHRYMLLLDEHDGRVRVSGRVGKKRIPSDLSPKDHTAFTTTVWKPDDTAGDAANEYEPPQHCLVFSTYGCVCMMKYSSVNTLARK